MSGKGAEGERADPTTTSRHIARVSALACVDAAKSWSEPLICGRHDCPACPPCEIPHLENEESPAWQTKRRRRPIPPLAAGGPSDAQCAQGPERGTVKAGSEERGSRAA
jgi:hypothetical protein